MPEAHTDLDDDMLAELLADRLVDLVTRPDVDPATRRSVTNALRMEAGLHALPAEIGRKAIATWKGTSVRKVREIEATGLERLREQLLPLLTTPSNPTP